MIAALLTSFLATAAAGSPIPKLPYAVTPASELSTTKLHHAEALRIRRDFGKAEYEIAVDAWGLGDDAPSRISDVRLWWAKTNKDGERSPFGKRVMKYLEIDYEATTADAWIVTFVGDRKQFQFSIELEQDGGASAYGRVKTADGTTIDHCRATSGRLVARRFLGIPIGIKRLAVHCVDDKGATHDGALVFKKTKRGKVYKP